MVYRIAKLIYKIALGVLLIIYLTGIFLAFASGHNTVITSNDVMQLLLIPLTLVMLLLHRNINTKKQGILRLGLVGLLFANVFCLTYALYEIVVICRCFTYYDNMTSSIIGVLTVIAIILIIGLAKNKF